MQNFQSHKNGWRRALESKPALILLTALLLFFAWNVIGFMGKMRETAVNKKLAEEKVIGLEQKKKQLSTEINQLGTQAGVEASIREKFGLAMPGEGVIVIVDNKNTPPPGAPQKSSFWTFLENWFI
jgi:cell division protein FtsB